MDFGQRASRQEARTGTVRYRPATSAGPELHLRLLRHEPAGAKVNDELRRWSTTLEDRPPSSGLFAQWTIATDLVYST